MSSKHPEAGEIRDREGVRRSLDGLPERDAPLDHRPADRRPQRDERPFRALLLQSVRTSRGSKPIARRCASAARIFAFCETAWASATSRSRLDEICFSASSFSRTAFASAAPKRRLGGDVLTARLARLHALDFAEDLSLLHLIADARRGVAPPAPTPTVRRPRSDPRRARPSRRPECPPRAAARSTLTVLSASLAAPRCGSDR